jgi:predicted oxidoreductase
LDFKYDPSDTKWTPIEEVLENLDYLVKSGKVRYVGLCNETPWGVTSYLKIAKEKKLPRIRQIEPSYGKKKIFDDDLPSYLTNITNTIQISLPIQTSKDFDCNQFF